MVLVQRAAAGAGEHAVTPRRVPGHRDGLFSWSPESGEVQPGELLINALTVACGHCHAPIGQRCSVPGRRGHPRHDCPPHPSRARAAELDQQTATLPSDAATSPRTEPSHG